MKYLVNFFKLWSLHISECHCCLNLDISKQQCYSCLSQVAAAAAMPWCYTTTAITIAGLYLNTATVLCIATRHSYSCCSLGCSSLSFWQRALKINADNLKTYQLIYLFEGWYSHFVHIEILYIKLFYLTSHWWFSTVMSILKYRNLRFTPCMVSTLDCRISVQNCLKYIYFIL